MNADKAIPEIEIEIGGKVRKLVFSCNAACLIEQVLGIEVLTGEWAKKPGFREVRAFLWGMLKADEPKLTLEEVGGWLNRDNIVAAGKAIIDAYVKAMATPEAAEKNG